MTGFNARTLQVSEVDARRARRADPRRLKTHARTSEVVQNWSAVEHEASEGGLRLNF